MMQEYALHDENMSTDLMPEYVLHEYEINKCLPIEMSPNYRDHTEPIPLHGPDYSEFTLRDLLHMDLLVVNYEGTSLVQMLEWKEPWKEPKDLLDPENEHVLRMMLSWQKIRTKTPRDFKLFPKFPLKLNINRQGLINIYE